MLKNPVGKIIILLALISLPVIPMALHTLSSAKNSIGAVTFPEHLKLKAKPETILGAKDLDDTVTEYAYSTDEVPFTSNEIPELRTMNSRTFDKGVDSKGKLKRDSIIFPGNPQFFKDKKNKWQQVEYATTTKDAFKEQMPVVKKWVAYAQTGIFFPDGSAVNGYLACDGFPGRCDASGLNWAGARADPNSWTSDTALDTTELRSGCISSCGRGLISRIALHFNTSSLTGVTISSGSVSLYYDSVDGASTAEATNPANISIVSNATASETGLVVNDYNITNFGSTRLANDITQANFISPGGYSTTTLTAAGISAITQGGITKFGIMGSNDLDNAAPSADSYEWIFSVRRTGLTQDPYLWLSYTIGGAVVPTIKVPDIINFY